MTEESIRSRRNVAKVDYNVDKALTRRSEPKQTTVSYNKPVFNKIVSFIQEVEDAINESEGLELLSEDRNSSDLEDLPCRLIQNFGLYHPIKKQWIKVEEIGESDDNDLAICAGYLEPIFDNEEEERFNENDNEDEDEDEDEDAFQNDVDEGPKGTLVKLTTIWHTQVVFKENGVSEIWFRTQFSHVKLGKPHPSYAPKFNPLFKHIRAANLLIFTLINEPEATLQGFERDLPRLSKNTFSYYDNPPVITASEFRTYLDYVRAQLESWIDERESFDLFSIPLCQSILDLSASAPIIRSGGGNARQKIRFGGSSTKDNTTPPVLTDLIREMATGFLTPQQRATHDLKEGPIYQASDENTVFWYGESVAIDKNRTIEMLEQDNTISDDYFYTKVKLDDEIIEVGDFVTFKDPISQRRRVALIRALLQDKHGTAKFIANVFIHGSETAIQELAGSQEFFATKEISTITLENMIGRCIMHHMPLTKDESEFKNSFFYRFGYDIETGAFINPTEVLKENGHDHDEITVNKQEVVYKDLKYHLYDFVYIIPTSQAGPYRIGQLVPFDEDSPTWFEKDLGKYSLTFQVRYLKRVERSVSALEANTTHGPKTIVEDPRNLILTDSYGTINIQRLEGKCFIQHKDDIEDLPEFTKNPDHFYISEVKTSSDEPKSSDTRSNIHYCQQCIDARNKKVKQLSETLNKSNPLVALDIFSGCGGLTYGLKEAGLVDTQYSVEYDRGAALSFMKNFPDATVYNQCANLVLKRAISFYNEGTEPSPARDFLGNKLPMLPPPGSVDMIYCGPPCQGFSGINRYKKANDIKNSLIATSLSYVDFYRPDYFLLENVRGLIDFKLGGEQDGLKIIGGVRQGILKFIIRSLTRMGYQARFSIQQAGFHGLSQSRRRLFIWGTKLGKTIPDFLQPSTCFSKSSSITIPLPFNVSYCSNKRSGQCAPHPEVNVYAAISDLPRFEYANPCKAVPNYKDTYEHLNQVTKFEVSNDKLVGYMNQEYLSTPTSEFQRWCRRRSTKLYQHVTRGFSELNVERIYHIPMVPGSDHHSLPDPLKPWCLSHKDSAVSRHNGWKGLYGRLDFKGHFQTAITDLNPMSKQGTVIHPSQRRVLSVREYARTQSFPDDFVFQSFIPDHQGDLHRQIGNAVPPLLALTLGQCLVEAKRLDMFQDNIELFSTNEISELSHLDKLATLDEAFIKRSLQSTQPKYSVNEIPNASVKFQVRASSNEAKRTFISRMTTPRTRKLSKVAYNEIDDDDDFENEKDEVIPNGKIRKFSTNLHAKSTGFRVRITERVKVIATIES